MFGMTIQRSEEGTTEGTELAERSGCHEKDVCEAIISGWQTSDTDAMGRSRARRVREVQFGSEGLPS